MTRRLMRLLIRPALLLSLFAGLVFCKSTTIRGAHQTMSSLHLSVELPVPAEILVGERLPVTVFLTNAGDTPVAVHDMTRTSGFTFFLCGQNPDGVSYEVSQQQSRQSKAARAGAEVLPSMGKKPRILKPGESTTPKKENVASYIDNAFAAGNYQVVVAYETLDGDRIESQPLSLNIKTPQIQCLTSVFCEPTGHFATVFSELSGNGAPRLFARQTITSNATDGTMSCLKDGPSGPVSDITVASFTVATTMSRWSLISEKDALFGIFENAGLSARTSSLKLILQDNVLIKPGFEFDDQTGIFFICGRSGNSWHMVQIRCFNGNIAAGPTQQISSSQPRFIGISRIKDGDAGRYCFFWVEEAGKLRHICALMLGEDGRAINDDPRVLYETFESVVGLRAPSTQPAADPIVTVLSSLHGSLQKLQLARIAYSSPGKPIEAVTVDGPKAPVSSWHLPEPSNDHGVLLAQSEKFLLWTQAGGDGQWRVLAHSDELISNVQLFITEPRVYWAQWVDAKSGLHFVRVPLR